MNFINLCPIGQDNPFYNDLQFSYWIENLYVQVHNQDDIMSIAFRWDHLFKDKGEAVYKPSDGDRLKYKAKISLKWWQDTYESGYKEFWVENLADGGQSITITPKMASDPERNGKYYPSLDLKVAMDTPSVSKPLMVADGTLYLVNQAGDLLMYRHNANGEFENYNGQTIGSGWGGLKHICPVRDGHIYAISVNDELLYYHHDVNGNFDVAGKVIGYGWGDFQWVGAGRFGQLYGVNTNGDLLYYRHGSAFNWEISGKVIGNGWGGFSKLFAGGTNCLYGVATNGDLLYYYHNDDLNWVHSRKVIGNSWGGFTSISSSGNGEVYAINANRELLFYRHDSNINWHPDSPRVIGWGWGEFSAHGALASAR